MRIVGLRQQFSLSLMSGKVMIFPEVLEKHRGKEVFAHRSRQLTKINSYHFFPIEGAMITDHPKITYKREDRFHLQELIAQRVQLRLNQIKCIIWQIVKLMLSCEQQRINHLRLYPRSIVLAEKYRPEGPIFLWVKDFSLGREFQSVKTGKYLQFFEYLHPDLSLECKEVNFDQYIPKADIWSLGIIIYQLIYFRSPFCKPGKQVFSKTILRDFKKGSYRIPFGKEQYKDIHKFISKCVSVEQKDQSFLNWKDIQRFILCEEDIYNELDFHDGKFEEMANIHCKAMYFFSFIYCLIIDQCTESPNRFWKKPISKEFKVPFQLLICQFTLAVMSALESRFYRLYSSHLFLLSQQVRGKLASITDKLKNQLAFVEKGWIEPKFKTKQLTPQVIEQIKRVCVQLKLEVSEENDKVEINNRESQDQSIEIAPSNMKKDSKNNKKTKKESKVWKSVQILFDYCDEILRILPSPSAIAKKEAQKKKIFIKNIFEELYNSKEFDAILKDQFHYTEDLSKAFEKVYKISFEQ